MTETWVLANEITSAHGRLTPSRCQRCHQNQQGWSLAGPVDDSTDCYWQCQGCGQINHSTRGNILRRIRRAERGEW